MRSWIMLFLLGSAGMTLGAKEAQAAPGISIGYNSRCGLSVNWSSRYGSFRGSSYSPYSYSRSRHVHRFVDYPRQVWVDPVYRTEVVGYDSCGRRIYGRRLLRDGYWSTTYERACRCGYRR